MPSLTSRATGRRRARSAPPRPSVSHLAQRLVCARGRQRRRAGAGRRAALGGSRCSHAVALTGPARSSASRRLARAARFAWRRTSVGCRGRLCRRGGRCGRRANEPLLGHGGGEVALHEDRAGKWRPMSDDARSARSMSAIRPPPPPRRRRRPARRWRRAPRGTRGNRVCGGRLRAPPPPPSARPCDRVAPSTPTSTLEAPTSRNRSSSKDTRDGAAPAARRRRRRRRHSAAAAPPPPADGRRPRRASSTREPTAARRHRRRRRRRARRRVGGAGARVSRARRGGRRSPLPQTES